LTVNAEVGFFSNPLQNKDEAVSASAGYEIRLFDCKRPRLIWQAM
jgi:hypothetical protein